MADSSPYSTVIPFLDAADARPTWAPASDQDRIASYKVYEDIFWNNPDTFKVVLRGTDARPIYVPTARTIIEATHRFVAPMPGISIQPSVLNPSPDAVTLAQGALDALFSREMYWTRFAGSKRYGLIRGDWIWHLVADPLKPEGQRISILPVDPSSYIPEYDEDDRSKMLAVNLIEPFIGADGVQYIKRQRYWKLKDSAGNIIGPINSSCAVWTMEGYLKDQPDPPVRVVIPPTTLNPEITAFPVYHIKNWEEPGNPFGSSELRGFERILTAIHQGATDEDLSLALDGLGVYATDAPPPADPNDPTKDGPWVIGPGRVVEVPGGKFFNRVQGLSSIQPYQDHLNFFINSIKEASGTPDMAIGKVDVAVAESGISLQLQLAPKLALADEKNALAKGKLNQMYFDLKTWLRLFEGINLEGCDITQTFGNPIPENKEAEVDQILKIHSAVPSLVTPEWTRKQLARVTGLDFTGITDEQLNALARERTDAQAGSLDTSAADPNADPNAGDGSGAAA